MSTDKQNFSTLSLSTDARVAILDGKLEWLPVRRHLGIQAFGTNAYRATRAGDTVIEDHVESPGQEEMYLVVSGQVRFVIDGNEVDVAAGEVVFVSDPESRRTGIALDDNTTVLAVGGWVDKPYHSLPWEPIYLAQEASRRGDWAAAAEILEREAGEHRDTAIIQYRLACCHAQLGEHELALSELERACEKSEQLRERAADDELLRTLHGFDRWSSAVTAKA